VKEHLPIEHVYNKSRTLINNPTVQFHYTNVPH